MPDPEILNATQKMSRVLSKKSTKVIMDLKVLNKRLRWKSCSRSRRFSVASISELRKALPEEYSGIECIFKLKSTENGIHRKDELIS